MYHMCHYVSLCVIYYIFKEGELWMAQNLFYEDLNTGLESFTPVITKIDLALFENVGSVLASFTSVQNFSYQAQLKL